MEDIGYVIAFKEPPEGMDIYSFNGASPDTDYKRILRLEVDDEKGRRLTEMNMRFFGMEAISLGSEKINGFSKIGKNKGWYIALEKGAGADYIFLRGFISKIIGTIGDIKIEEGNPGM